MLQQATPDISIASKRVRERERAGLTSATPERMAKAGLENVEVGEGTLIQRIVDAPLDRLMKAGTITRREFEAGERYRNDVYLAQVDPSPPTVDPNRTGGAFGPRTPSAFASQAIADARGRYREIERRIPQHSLVHALLVAALVKEHNFEDIAQSLLGRRDRETGAMTGKVAVRVALASLADHYDVMNHCVNRKNHHMKSGSPGGI